MFKRVLQVGGFVLSTLFFIMPNFAIASGLSVAPSKLVIDAEDKNAATLLVKNISKDDALFEIYPDDMIKAFNIHPESFVLKSGQSREVFVDTYGTNMSLVQTNISIISRPTEESSLMFGSGIKIPVTIYARDSYSSKLLASLLVTTPVTRVLLWVLGALISITVIVIFSKKFYK